MTSLRRALRRFLELAAGALSRLAPLIYRSEQERASLERQNLERQWYADHGDETLRLDYDLDPGSLVLDAGGYRGNFAADIFCRFGCRIEVFEPVGPFAEAIERRFAHNPLVTVHRFGLGGESRGDSILVDEGASSAVLAPVGVEAKREKIEICDVVEVIDGLDREEIDLLKVNIEGSEFELLERLLSAGRASAIRHLQIQFHPRVPDAQSRRRAIQEGLSATHRQMWDYPWIWESWERRP